MQGLKWNRTQYLPISLSIGTRFVNLIQLKSDRGGLSISSAVCAPIPEEADRDRALTLAIRDALSSGDFKGRQMALCLKGEDVSVQHQRMALEGKGDAAERIREEFRRNIPFDPDRAEVRYIVTGRVYERNEIRDELILMIADRDVVDRYLKILDELHLVTVKIGVEPVELMRAVLHFPPTKEISQGATGFMNIGASKTELIVIREGGLAFTRSIPMGGEKFTQAISEKLEIDLPSAMRLKQAISRMEPLNETLKSAALTAIRPVMEGMCTEVQSCFRYFSSIFNRESVNRLIVSGQEVGGIINAEFLEPQVDVPVLAWNPSQYLETGDSFIQQHGFDTSFAPVIGLSIESLEPSDDFVDFMPRDVIEKRKQKRSKMLRIASLAAIILVMALIQVITIQRAKKLEYMRKLVETRCNLIDMKSTAVQSLDYEEKVLEEKRALLVSARPLVRVSRVLAEVTRNTGGGVSLRNMNLQSARLMRGEETVSSYVIQIEGWARRPKDISDFVQGLRHSNAFVHVREENFQDMAIGDRDLMTFTLTLTVSGEVENEAI